MYYSLLFLCTAACGNTNFGEGNPASKDQSIDSNTGTIDNEHFWF